MASAKKKQDEKNLKMLRELVSQPGNKECFDCQQRGPTYVNMTIGSFVCTSCSGMLRGLTPPHRVKSISMATFTQEDIDFLKERGNEFCRAIWLGLMPQSIVHSGKDEQKIKDFMCAKYELKRYYLDPVMANQLLSQKSQNCTKEQASVKNSSVKLLPAKLTKSSVSLSNTKSNETELVNLGTINFVADFSKVPDLSPFNIPTINCNQPISPQPSFANFDNNPIFNSPEIAVVSNINGTNIPPSEDRYAALKDLDSLMKKRNFKNDSVSSKTLWNLKDTNNENSSGCIFDRTNSLISNPFVEDMWQPSENILNNNNNSNISFQQMETKNLNTANPFRSTQVPVFNNDFHKFGRDSQNLENVSSNLLSNLSNKSWQPAVTGFRVNPFSLGSAIGDAMRNSNNPFL